MQNFKKPLLQWFQEFGRRELPWRKKDITPYEVWVSEIMLQQTQVSRVIGYYDRFIERFPDIFSLAKSDWSDFLPYYQGLGYYRRGRNMLETAKTLVANHGGKFPKNKILLSKLPGIGEYTACAILSFGYGLPHIAFDTNVKKVIARYLYGTRFATLDNESVQKKIGSSAPSINAAIMDLANLVCMAKPRCEDCPIRRHCEYNRQLGINEIRPKPLITRKFPMKKAHVCLFLHENHKKYFSKNDKKFEPFKLPPSMNTRERLKRYFLETFGLNLSIRPPHKKILLRGLPTLFINAQILSGNHHFFEYPAGAVKK